jgi:hypothetical protein
LLKNNLDVESATMLAKIGTEKGIMLSGMKRDQTEASFSNQSLQPADAILIGSDLQFMAVMKNLSVAYNSNIVGEAAQQLAEAALGRLSLEVLSGVPIKELHEDKLTELNLRSKGLGSTEGIVLAELIKFSAVVTTLFLGGNSIGVEGAKAIAEALKVNAVLTDLRLDWNNIGAEGAIAIAEALKVNAVVTKLVLGGNDIGDEGAIAIAEALKVTAVLTKLDLEYNNMGDAGKKAVQDAVRGRSGFVLEL